MPITVKMANRNKNSYYWNFEGAKLSKRETKIVSLSVLFGFIGALVAILASFEKSKAVGFGIASFFALIGYIIGRNRIH
ncbi:MAG: hypothetical protein ACREX3_14085 [Gammaproteobacteria bacterium]